MTVMEPLPPDPYKALGVGQDAALSAIKSAYRKLALQCHPDKVLDPTLKATKQDEFQRVQQAYEILSDETKKREYDDDVKLRKLREEVYKHAPHPSSAARPSPKNYYEYNVRTAEPPPNFRPGPPPAATARSPYATGNPQFTSSWDREIPTRSSKNIYDEDRKPRRTTSHEKASRSQEELKDERRRREKVDDDRDRRRVEREAEKAREREREREKEAKRERQRDRERAEQREKERERERLLEKEKRKADEKRIKKERERERERMEKEADKLRKQQQEEKFSKKAAYVEHHDESDDNHRAKKASGSSSKKHIDSPRSRDKSDRRDESPRAEAVIRKDKADALLGAAADYMHQSRRKGSKSGTPGYYPEQAQQQYSSQYRDPEEWRPSEGVKSRRPSHDDKYTATVEDEPNIVNVKPQVDPMERPPRLQKSYTSPPGQMHMPNTSAPRAPHLSRAATMDTRGTPPAVPQGPEPSRHSKSDRRRRSSLEEFDDRPRRSMATHRMHSYQVGRDDESPRVVYRQTDEVYAGGRGSQFDKVKMQTYSHEPMYSSKRYQDDDIAYSNVPHSASYSYGHARAYA